MRTVECRAVGGGAFAGVHARGLVPRRAVDYKNLGSEELGSIYESLLELHPLVNTDAATSELTAVSGSERKTTGSYYTPSSLIQVLINSALEPVIGEALKRAGTSSADQQVAILNLKVVDPACGCGTFSRGGGAPFGTSAGNRAHGRGRACPRGDALRSAVGHLELYLWCGYQPDVGGTMQGEPVDGSA